MQLNFRQLEVFRAIMIAKTVSGAAELLHVSQPGISRLLKYMEYKLGIALFERHKGRLIPTPEGEELFHELEPIYQRIEELDVTIDRITRPDNHLYQIACTPSLATYVLPRLLARVKACMPHMQVKLEALSNEEITDFITQRRVDFALAFYDTEHPLVMSEPSINVGMVAVVPQDHPLAKRKSLQFSDLVEHELVMYYPETLLGTTLNKALDALDSGHPPRMAAMVRYGDDACAMVEQGLGITVVFEYTAMPHRFPKLRTIPIKTPKQQVHFLRHNGISLSNNVRQFYELMKTEIRSLNEDIV